MAIPDYETLMLPFLKAVSDGREYRRREITIKMGEEFALSKDERQRLLPSGQQTILSSRVGWASTYLRKAGLMESPKRGFVRITSEGTSVLKRNPAKIDNSFLNQYPQFVEFKKKKRVVEKQDGVEDSAVQDNTPEEMLESAILDLRNALADEILEQVKSCSPQFFERLVVELLVAMGYGGSLADAGRAVGRTGDEGIDGIINEDKLGLDVVCIQAKRWTENTVGRPVVQAFAGSMEGVRAKKGVLITTSSFSKDARNFVKRIERKIVLIDGNRLADLMVDHGIGVTTIRSFQLKRIDSDYFAEDDD